MNKATNIMSSEISKLNFKDSHIKLISNVTANEIKNVGELKELFSKTN